MNKKIYYVTTPLYYVNAKLHIGGAYTTIVADTLKRYYQLQGYDTFFLTGSDEHGQKIANAAEAKKIKPKEFADEIVGYFKNLWQRLDIKHDFFIRTTDVFHERVVKAFFKKLETKGLVYKGIYRSLYCTGCEKPYAESELDEKGNCPIHKTKPDLIEEENYFFKLSEFTQPMIDYLTKNPQSLQPDSRRAEILGKLRADGLQDVSVSRNVSKLTWGVSMPDDETQVVWVWFDALINYVSTLLKDKVEQFADKPDPLDLDELLVAADFKKFWSEAVHLIGKDILWHHTVIWWPMLLGVGITPPKTVWAHGWWSVEGQKISKSLGTAIDPTFIADYFGTDALRYYLLREITFGNDGDFSIQQLVNRINNDLGKGGLGNFAQRVLNMLEKYCESIVPAIDEAEFTEADAKLIRTVTEALSEYQDLIEKYKFNNALDALWKALNAGSLYVDEQKPWVLAKDAEQKKRLDVVLYNLTETLRLLAYAFLPIIPDGATKILEKLSITTTEITTRCNTTACHSCESRRPKVFNHPDKSVILSEAKNPSLKIDKTLRENLCWGLLKPSTKITKGEAIYPVVSSALIIKDEIKKAVATVKVEGFLDGSTSSELADKFTEIAKKGATECLLDVEKVVYFSAPATPAIKRALNKFEKVILVKFSDDFKKVLTESGFSIIANGQIIK